VVEVKEVVLLSVVVCVVVVWFNVCDGPCELVVALGLLANVVLALPVSDAVGVCAVGTSLSQGKW